jgi:hypothetical protein
MHKIKGNFTTTVTSKAKDVTKKQLKLKRQTGHAAHRIYSTSYPINSNY